jgi:SAM-dependent methyltransferase
MINDLFTIMRCPFCGSLYAEAGFHLIESHNGYGILECDCSSIPVVDNIPIVFTEKVLAKSITIDHIKDLIKKENYKVALSVLVSPPSPKYPDLVHPIIRVLPTISGINKIKKMSHSHGLRKWREKVESVFVHNKENNSARILLDLYYRQSGLRMPDAYDYFYYKFAQPRSLVALAYTTLISNPFSPVLDLGCGYGHIMHYLLNGNTERLLVGIDREYFPLYVAKHFIAPGAQFICSDINMPLPLADSVFSVVLCNDVFHYINQKMQLMREARRVALGNAFIVYSSVRNRLQNDPYSGYPLSPKAYHRLFENYTYSVLSNTDILIRYLEKMKPDLSRSASIKELEKEHLMSFIISDYEDIYTDHGSMEIWPHAKGKLTINPLYTQEYNNDMESIKLKRLFPSVFYEIDNVEYMNYLPENITIPKSLIKNLSDAPDVQACEELIQKCILIGTPQKFQ